MSVNSAVTEADTPLSRLWRATRAFIIASGFTVGSTFILLFSGLPGSFAYNLIVGDIAVDDIRAPRDISYISRIETEAARQSAAASVEDVFDPPDPRIGRQQVRRARQIMDFVQTVRADSLATLDLQVAYLRSITVISVSPDDAEILLAISDAQFELVEHEVVSLIEEAMSGTVREGRVEEVTGRLELAVSTDLPEPLIPITLAVARDLIVPNSILNAEATEAARAQAVAAVPEIRHTYQQGEVIIRAGERVEESDLEALVALGLTTGTPGWEEVASALLASLTVVAVMLVYLVAFNPPWTRKLRNVGLIGILFLIFMFMAQMMSSGAGDTIYLFPAAALALALRALIGPEFAALSAILLALMVGYETDGSLEIAAFTVTSGLLAAGSLRRSPRLSAFFVAGILAALGGAAVLLVFHLPTHPDPAQMAGLLALAVLNGLLSAGLTLVILFVVGSVTGMTSALQLIDLMRPDHPLQRRLQSEAVGTYQHTLAVANLVEASAEAIGGDTLLARVGVLYHDIGKLNNPAFYIENRIEGGPDPHQRLTPGASARIIRQHVADGLELARRHRLPNRVAAFIAEHHGTLPILYFLAKAREQATADGVQLDEREYYYAGPIPRSRETALLMLADGCESAVRANRPVASDDIEKIVERIFQFRVDARQLDESGLTLNDLKAIRETFIHTLKGMYHPRVRYPGDEQPASAAPGNQPAPVARKRTKKKRT